MIYGCGAPSRGIFEGKTTGQSIRTRPGFARIAKPLIRALSVAAWRGVERGFVSFIVEYGSTGAAVILAFLKMSGNSATACHAGLFRRVCKRCNAAARTTVQNSVGAVRGNLPGCQCDYENEKLLGKSCGGQRDGFCREWLRRCAGTSARNRRVRGAASAAGGSCTNSARASACLGGRLLGLARSVGLGTGSLGSASACSRRLGAGTLVPRASRVGVDAWPLAVRRSSDPDTISRDPG